MKFCAELGSIIPCIDNEGITRTATGFGREIFVAEGNNLQPTNSAKKISILDFAVVLDTPLVCCV